MTEAINSSQSDEMPDPESAVDWAVWLAKKGMYVFPVDHPDAPVCKGLHPKGVCSGERGKHPLVKWSEASTRDIPTIYDWASGSAVNFAIDCGKSNLLVVDADTGTALFDFIGSEVGQQFGAKIPDTLMVETGKGGHVYFQQPGDAVMTNSPGLFKGHDIDVRGQGGYVIAPGSKHASGKRYSVIGDDTVIRPVPDWVKKVVKGGKAAKERTRASTTVDADTFLMEGERRSFSWATAFEDAATVPNGAQRDFLISAIGSMCARGIPEEIAVRTLLDLAARLPLHKADQPWEDEYVQAMYEEMSSKWQEEHSVGLTFEDRPAPAQDTEDGEKTSGEVSDGWMTDQYRKWFENPEFRQDSLKELRRRRVKEVTDAYLGSKLAGELPESLSLSDLLARPQEGPQWRIAGLLPSGGRVVFAAARKAGKTTTVVNLVKALADAAAEDEDEDPFVKLTDPNNPFAGIVNGFLGTARVHDVPGTIVVVDNEMSERQLQQWYQDARIKNTDRVHLIPLRGKAGSFDIRQPAIRARWVKKLKALPGGCSFIVLDCLAPFLGALGLGETNDDVNPFLVAVDDLLEEAGIPDCVLVHHMGHGDERSRGASRLRDWPDVEWKLVRERDDQDHEVDHGARFFSAFGRDVDVRESQLTFDQATRRLTLGSSNRSQYKASRYEAPVLEYVRSNPGRSQSVIVAAMLQDGLPKTKLEKAVKYLRETGRLHTVPAPRNALLHFTCDDVKCEDPENCLQGQTSD